MNRYFNTTFKSNSAFIILIATVLALTALIQTHVQAAYTFAPYQYELVTATADGRGLVNGRGQVSGVSWDGNKILFSSTSTNLPNSSSTATWSGYMRDMNNSEVTRVDLLPDGTLPNQQTMDFVMNMTGRYIAFSSYASNLVTTPSTDTYMKRVYFKDLSTNQIELITNLSSPAVPQDAEIKPISISDDGRYILITTRNINKLIPNTRTTNTSETDVVLYDRSSQNWVVVNKTPAGDMPSSSTYATGMSCDGSFILLSSTATDLTTNHSGSGSHVLLADTRNGLKITDLTPGSMGSNSSANISCNGRYVTYATQDRTLIPTPAEMNTTSSQAVRYDRFTNERTYIGSSSNNTTYNTYFSRPVTVTDAGDALIVWGGALVSYDQKVYFKHLSDGSGTLEKVQNNYAGLNASENYYMTSGNGKYVVTSTQDAYILGLPVVNNSSVSRARDVIRVSTNL